MSYSRRGCSFWTTTVTSPAPLVRAKSRAAASAPGAARTTTRLPGVSTYQPRISPGTALAALRFSAASDSFRSAVLRVTTLGWAPRHAPWPRQRNW